MTQLRTIAIALILVGGLVGASVMAQDAPPTTPAAHAFVAREGDVRVRCSLTVGGSFDVRTRMLSGTLRRTSDTGALDGELVVDLNGLQTGISLRDQHLRDNYLEVGKGPEFARAVLTDIRLTGISGADPVGKAAFTGRLRLHGVEQPVTGQVELRRSGDGLRVRASFPLVIEHFGIAKPRYLGVGVKDEVTVQVAFQATSTETTR